MTQSNTINKRKVFYISGFDPRGASYYYRLYNNESAKLGRGIKIGKRSVHGRNPEWKVTTKQTFTDYTFLKWDDIVRQHWTKNPLKLYARALQCYFYYIFSGTVGRGLKISLPPVLSFIYPLFLIAGVILAALVVGNFAAGYFPKPFSYFAYLVTGAGILFVSDRVLMKSNAYWLMRLYNFCYGMACAPIKKYDERMAEFAETIKEELRKDKYDEILLVGHSAGSICLMSVVAEMLRKGGLKENEKLKIITLGQCVPLLGLVRKAENFRKDVNLVSELNINWLDVTAPADGVCFAFTGPFVGVCKAHNPRLKLISARFHKMFEPEKYRSVKRNRFLTHFLYLMAADNEVEYDYFAITAGNKKLEERFAATPAVAGYKKSKRQNKKL